MKIRFLAASALLLAGAAPENSPVVVAVSGIAAASGQVRVEICPEQMFSRKHCTWNATAPAARGTTTVTVIGVPPGRYAALAYWDANANGKVDRNFIGIPQELIGFSNDVRVHMSPPAFSAAAFVHGTTISRISFGVHKIP